MGVKISMRGFGEVSAASAARKHSTLKRYRFPESDESKGRSNYYVKALSLIKKYHRGYTAQVKTALQDLSDQATVETDRRRKAKLLNNHRAVIDYLVHFGDRALDIKPGKRLYYVFEDVVVSAHPDLVVEEDGSLILIKLNLSKEDLPGGVNALMLHVFYEAARRTGLPVKPISVECLQANSGSRTVGPISGFPDNSILEGACKELLALW